MVQVTSGSAVENGPGGLCIAHLDRALRVTEASDGFLAGLGRPSAAVCGRHFGQFVHATVKPTVLECLGRVAEGRVDRFSTRFRGPDDTGESFAGGMTGLAVRGTDRRISRIALLVEAAVGATRPALRAGAEARKLLSGTDAEVLEGVAAGYSTVRLADRLFLSPQGVDYHVGTLLRRFRCPNRPALVAKAYAQGVLHPGSWPPRVTSEFRR